MKNRKTTVTIFQMDATKAKEYIRLQNEGVPQLEATYKIFGNTVGDEMLKMKQHELIFEEPILN